MLNACGIWTDQRWPLPNYHPFEPVALWISHSRIESNSSFSGVCKNFIWSVCTLTPALGPCNNDPALAFRLKAAFPTQKNYFMIFFYSFSISARDVILFLFLGRPACHHPIILHSASVFAWCQLLTSGICCLSHLLGDGEVVKETLCQLLSCG